MTLRAPAGEAAEVAAFYDRMGIDCGLRFEGGEGRPFYHVALLVPGDRFDAALAWARERVDLLPGGERDEVVFEFANWNALATYFHDPAGNIVELIAHLGREPSGRDGAFDGGELLGLSEVGLVGDPASLAGALAHLDLHLWDGALLPGRLAFVGDRARTFILAPAGRGWLPTGRAAEPHPVRAILGGTVDAEVAVGGHHFLQKEQEPPV